MRKMLVLALILVAVGGLIPQRSMAQAPVQTAVPNPGDRNLITNVDCGADFPTCTFTLSAPALAGPLVAELAKASIDFKVLELQRPAEQVQPLQVKFVLDAPAIVRERQLSQRFAEAIRKLLDAYKREGKDELLNQDWWSAQVIGAEAPDRLTAIADWQYGDYGGFINTVDGYINERLPAGGPQTTSIFGPVLTALQKYEGVRSTRVLVLFSDGYDTTSTVTLDDLIAAAQAANVRVYTVQHLGGGDAQAGANLQRLAEETGGQFLALENATDLAPLWQALLQEQAATTYTFTLPDAAPGNLTVGVNRQDGERLAETVPMPPVAAPALQIEGFTVNGSAGDRLELSPDTGELTVQLKLGVGSGDVMSRIERVEYWLSDQIFVQQAPPFDTYTLPLQGMTIDDEALPLVAKVYDKYGPVQTSSTVTVQRQPLPAPPVATIAGTAGAVTESSAAAATQVDDGTAVTTTAAARPAEITEGQLTPAEGRAEGDAEAAAKVDSAGRSGSGAASVTTPADDGAGVSGPTLPDGVEGLLALIRLLGQAGVLTLSAVVLAAALLGVLVARKLWPRKQTRVVKDPNSRGSDIDGDGTQPTDFEGESTNPVQEIFARARMELVPDKRDKDDVKLREEIHFYLRDAGSTRQEWKLGRSYEYCECVIDDPLKRISRLHATIIEEGGKFYIRDEGSAGGTYINKRKLTPQIPQQLRDNDLINLNVVAYRFFAGDELGPDPYAGAGGGGQEEGTTEPAAANSWYPPNPDATEKAEADLL